MKNYMTPSMSIVISDPADVISTSLTLGTGAGANENVGFGSDFSPF